VKEFKKFGVRQDGSQECKFVEVKQLLSRREEFESKELRFPQRRRGGHAVFNGRSADCAS